MRIKGAYVEITNRCNLNCRDCYNSSGLNKTTEELDVGAFIRFVDILHTSDKTEVITISGGEPLLHTHFNEILKEISGFAERHPDVSFNFITNGTTYNELFYDLLERNSGFAVQISLDGPNEYANASMRGEGNFTRVINNISGRRFKNKPIFKMIINKANAPYVEEYAHFVWGSLGGIPGYGFAVPYGNAVHNWGEMTVDPGEAAAIIVKIRDIYEKYGITGVPLPLPSAHCELTDSASDITVCVRSNGLIQPCQNFYDDRFSVGSIYELDRDAVIDNITHLTELLARRLSGELSEKYGCNKCPIHGKCGRGCPAIADAVCGDMLASDGECDLRRIGTLRLIKSRL